MSTQEILAELPRLPAEDLGLVAELARNLQEEKQNKISPEVYELRVASGQPSTPVNNPASHPIASG